MKDPEKHWKNSSEISEKLLRGSTGILQYIWYWIILVDRLAHVDHLAHKVEFFKPKLSTSNTGTIVSFLWYKGLVHIVFVAVPPGLGRKSDCTPYISYIIFLLFETKSFS